MKNYELIQKLSEFPAGTEVKILVSSCLDVPIDEVYYDKNDGVQLVGLEAMIVDSEGTELGTTDQFSEAGPNYNE